MSTKNSEMAMTTLVAMSQAPERFSPTEIKNFYEGMLTKMPCIVVWKDRDFKYVFCNQISADLLKLSSPSEVVGKTDFELGFNVEAARSLRQIDEEIVRTGKPALNIETTFGMSDGRVVHLSSHRIPLFNSTGEVIGILGVGVDITAQKEAERLRLENERNEAALQEQEKFAQLARKVAHDINSPLASLKMMLPSCAVLPEAQRTLLTRATESILDIANNLLTNYHKQKTDTSGVEQRQPLLVSDLLVQLLSEKKMQYRNHPVTLETVIASDAHFAFVKMQPTEFRRSVSNLINNAVHSLEDNMNGKVTIHLTVDTDALMVEVQDNGKGMTVAMIEKILNRQGFTEGKENGHGLGLQQVWDTLEYNQGLMEVQSELGKGTSIQITFPRIGASDWIAQDIHLIPDNIIVILDDDESIHTAWDLRFAPLMTSYPSLQIHHFTQGQEALNFLAGLSQQQRVLVIFLSDYELLQQRKNGLEVLKESGIKHAILVTSYYSNPKIREEAGRLGIKILPKQMASIIPILFVNENVASDVNGLPMTASFKPIEIPVPPQAPLNKKPVVQKSPMVLLDDDQVFADAIVFRLSFNKVVTHFPDPNLFLNECEKYAKDTLICIDQNFGKGIDIKGIQVAEQLHALEFTRLFLVSGDYFAPGTLPEYLTLLRKPEDLDLLDTL
jgi:PAS domain S-box-containing protein